MANATAPGQAQAAVRQLGRYELHARIAQGGMATVHLGRLRGEVGFTRCVAIKRLHGHFANDPDFVGMFIDEGKLAARVRHPNVVPTLDVVATEGELFLVMEYVHGESLSRLLTGLSKRGVRIPVDVVVAIALDMLEGLHAAHEAKSERGTPLEIVHRDVSPQNVLVGSDGVVRVFDFGVAKAADRMHSTQDGSVKGKIAYMSPEQLTNQPVDRRADVWAASVVIWEMLSGCRLFVADSPAALVYRVLNEPVLPPSRHGAPPMLDAIVLKGLAHEKGARFQTARELAKALEQVIAPASNRAVAEWLESVAGDTLRARAARVEDMERYASEERPSGAPGAEHDAFGPRPDATELASGWRRPEHAASAPPFMPAMPPQPPEPAESTRTIALVAGAVIAASLSVAVVMLTLRGPRSEPSRNTEPEPSAPVATVATAASDTAPPPETSAALAETAPASASASTAVGAPGPTAPTVTARRAPGPPPAKPASTKPKSDFGTGPW